MKDNYWEDCISKDGHTYIDDIADGKLKIFNVPQEHRTNRAYMYALRQLVGGPLGSEKEAYIEKRLIETLLLNDIIDAYKRGEDPEYIDSLKVSFRYYFCPSYDAPPPAYDFSLCSDNITKNSGND